MSQHHTPFRLSHSIPTAGLILIFGGTVWLVGIRAAEGAPVPVIQSYVGQAAPDAPDLVSYLVRAMGPQVLLDGGKLARLVEQRLSAEPGSAASLSSATGAFEDGRDQFLEGEYELAVPLLRQAVDEARRLPQTLLTQQDAREMTRQALLFLAHALLRTNRRNEARTVIEDLLRSFTATEPSLRLHGPELLSFFREVRSSLAKIPPQTLVIESNGPHARALLNQRPIGPLPAKVEGVLPGSYQLYVQRNDGGGRIHSITVRNVKQRIVIDTRFDHALQTHDDVRLVYGDRSQQARFELNHARRIGQSLNAQQLILFSVQRFRGRRCLQGRTLDVSKGRVIRDALLPLEPQPPEPALLLALGHYLLDGRSHPSLIVKTTAPLASRSRWRVITGWTLAAAGVASLAAGVPLIVLDGNGTCSDAPRCPQRYNTMLPGALLTAIGGAAAVTGAALLLWPTSAPASTNAPRSTTAFSPWITPSSAGAAVLGAF